LAEAAAVLAVCTIAMWPALTTQRSHASDHPVSAYDRQVAELRNLRQHFETGVSAERQSAHRRHAAICVSMAEQAWNCWYGRDEELWLHRFTECNEEMRTALKWLLANDPEQAMGLSGDLTRFWYVRGFPREGYQWLTDSLARSSGPRTIARARALVGVA